MCVCSGKGKARGGYFPPHVLGGEAQGATFHNVGHRAIEHANTADLGPKGHTYAAICVGGTCSCLQDVLPHGQWQGGKDKR